MEIFPKIEVDEKVRFGKPVVKGTRVQVDRILGKLGSGIPYEEVIAEYELTQEDILEVLIYASKHLADESPILNKLVVPIFAIFHTL